jgi:hypothetical protein
VFMVGFKEGQLGDVEIEILPKRCDHSVTSNKIKHLNQAYATKT